MFASQKHKDIAGEGLEEGQRDTQLLYLLSYTLMFNTWLTDRVAVAGVTVSDRSIIPKYLISNRFPQREQP